MSKLLISERDFQSRKFPQGVLAPMDTLLFGASEPGAWYDPSDMSTLFQDSAGTVPVTAVEQPVGRILDKSGRGNHATQATTTKRPTLKQDANGCYYLRFDGVDDAMVTVGNVDLSGTDKMTVWAGVTKLSDAAPGYVVNHNGIGAGSFRITAPAGADSQTYQFGAGGSTVASPAIFGVAAPHTAVLSAAADIAGNLARIKINNASNSGTGLGTGSFSNVPLSIGSRSDGIQFFNGRLYSLIVRGAQTPLSQLEATELYIKQKMRMP